MSHGFKKPLPTKAELFKDCFTLRQYAAFSLIFNWIWLDSEDSGAGRKNQYKQLTNTFHFKKLYQGGSKEPYNFENLLKSLRDYFSHYNSSPEPYQEELKKAGLPEELEFLVLEAIANLEQRNTKSDQDEDQAQKIQEALNKIKKNPRQFFPLDVSQNIQPALTLIAAPFMTRSQMAFLTGKFFDGGGRKEKKDDPEHLAKIKILQVLAQNDRVLVGSGEEDRFISKKKEAGLAIWGRLETAGLYSEEKEAKAPAGFPEDPWFMRQLVLYLEHTKALSSVEFARIKTKRNQTAGDKSELKGLSGILEQETVFDSGDRSGPLRIRHNTIEAEVKINGGHYRTNFGIQTLKYLVPAHLLKNRPKNELNDFVVSWQKENLVRKGRTQKTFGAVKTRLEKHIQRLIDDLSKQKKEEIKLYEQIRFICRFLNEAWHKKHERYMRAEEFKEIQQKVRHYRKDIFQKNLKENGLWDISGLGLGQDDNRTVSAFFLEDRIQNVFWSMRKARLEWLEQQKEKLDSLSEEDLKNLAVHLRLRDREQKEPQADLKPTALRSKEIKEKLEEWRDSKKPAKRFFEHVRELSGKNPISFQFFGLREEEYKEKNVLKGERESRENWARTGLLALMIPNLLGRTDSLDFSKKPSQQDVEENLGDGVKIKFKVTQGWRHYADFNKRDMKKLIKIYGPPDFKGVLPLLDKNSSNKQLQGKNQNKKSLSVRSLKQEADKERELLMRAILEWERRTIKEKNIQRKKGNNYISFKEILDSSDVSEKEDLTKARNACMHNKIWDRPFSKAPEPLQTIYNDLLKKDQEKRKKQKKEARKQKSNKEKAKKNQKTEEKT